MLRLENCTITQGDFTLRANLDIKQGARVAVIGPSGGGKSTFLGGIAGFVPMTGQISWHNAPMATHPGDRPISILFQSHNLFPHLTVFQNVAVGIASNLRLTPGQTEQINQVLHQVGLADKANARPG
ncbi:MAG: ATP-binding cassette domain-containing protein, partial [Planktomarina sp.]